MSRIANAADIINAIGSPAIEQRLSVSVYSVRHAKVRKTFPASWYGPLKDLCDELGFSCPRSAFAFKSSTPNDKKLINTVGDESASSQVSGVK